MINLIRSKLASVLPSTIYRKLRKLRKFFLSHFHKDKILFPHDGNILINVPKTSYRSYVLQNAAINHEPIKRKIINIILQSSVFKKKNIIDVGCHCGDNSIPWAKLRKSKVYAIDPSRHNINYIKDVCGKNNIKNLKTFCCAISDTCDQKYSYAGDDDEMYHIELSNYKKEKINKFIFSETTDNLVVKNNIKNVGLIHVDAEGFDYKILKGSKKTIKKNLPLLIMEVFLKTDNFKKIISFLKDNKYKAFLINEKSGNDNFVRNVLAVPKFIDYQKKIKNINKTLHSGNYSQHKFIKNQNFILDCE